MRKGLGTAFMATAAVATLTLAACSSGGGSSNQSGQSDASADGDVKLTIMTFNEFGYDDLIAEYMELNPGVTIEHTRAATGDEAREKIMTGLAANSGLPDVVPADTAWLPELMQYSDRFVDLTDPEIDGRWFEWKTAQATDLDGKLLAYGTDIGPQAVAYRADLFEAAGLPSDREAVAELLGGDNTTWESYLAAGKKYHDATGKAWFDSADAIYEGMINQEAEPYETPAGDFVALENPTVREYYDTVLDASGAGLSAGLSQWSADWQAAFQSDNFATILAPSWMLSTIEQNSAGSDARWDIAGVFPGGGGNWGGSYLMVPTQSKQQEAAKAFSAWLTAPEQQVKAFLSKGNFPSTVEAANNAEVLASTNPSFNDAPTGEIYSQVADKIEVAPYKGDKFFAVTDAIRDAIDRVDVTKTEDKDASWDKFVSEMDRLR